MLTAFAFAMTAGFFFLLGFCVAATIADRHRHRHGARPRPYAPVALHRAGHR